jgi:hypothetical protein
MEAPSSRARRRGRRLLLLLLLLLLLQNPNNLLCVSYSLSLFTPKQEKGGMECNFPELGSLDIFW